MAMVPTKPKKWDFSMKKIICFKLIEWPKMQNEHSFFLFGNPNVRGGGGGQAGWDKIPTYRPNFYSEGSPKE